MEHRTGIHPDMKGTPPFEEQLTKHRKEIQYPGGTVNILQIKPETPEGPPILYHYGWGADDDIIGADLKYFYDNNREVVTISKPITDRPPKVDDGEEYSGYTLRNALAEVAIAEELGYKKIDMLGHSLGTSNTLLAANLMLERGIEIGNIVLVNPSGFGNPSKIQLAKRQLDMMVQEKDRNLPTDEKKKQADETVKSTLGTLRKNPRELIGEGFGVSEVNMSELVARLLRKNVTLSVVHSADDPYVYTQDLNTEVQLAAQTIRQERARVIKEMVDSMSLDELHTQIHHTEDKTEQQIRRQVFDQKINALQDAETDQPLLSSVPSGGHFLAEYPQGYLPIVVDMLKQRGNRIGTIVDDLPYPTEEQQKQPSYLQKEPPREKREIVAQKIRNATPTMFKRLSPLHHVLRTYPSVRKLTNKGK